MKMAKRRLIDIGKCKSKPFELSSLRQTLLLPRPKMDRTAWLDPLSRLELNLACSSADESHRCNILDGGQNVCVVLYADRPEPRVEDQVPAVVPGMSYPVLSQRPKAVTAAVSGELRGSEGQNSTVHATQGPGIIGVPVKEKYSLSFFPTSPGCWRCGPSLSSSTSLVGRCCGDQAGGVLSLTMRASVTRGAKVTGRARCPDSPLVSVPNQPCVGRSLTSGQAHGNSQLNKRQREATHATQAGKDAVHNRQCAVLRICKTLGLQLPAAPAPASAGRRLHIPARMRLRP